MSKYFSLVASSSLRSGAIGISRKRFSFPSGATDASVLDGALT